MPPTSAHGRLPHEGPRLGAVRNVRDASQRNAYARGAKTLWNNLKHGRRRGRLGRGLRAPLRALPAPLRHAAVRPGAPGGHRGPAAPARLQPGGLLVRHLRHLQQGDEEGARVQDRRQPRRERRLLRRQDLQRLRPLRVEAPVAAPPAPIGARATRARSTRRATSSRRSAATRATPTTSPSPSRAEPPCSLSGWCTRRVTFSRNVTLSLSRTCVSHCKYCAFATHRPHLHEPAEVERLLDGAARRRVKELLVLTGDQPAHHPGVRERLEALGFEDFVAYVAWCCERALERGILPHTNLGALPREDLARLREVTASQGLMLESMRDDLVAHQGSPTKDPALRLETIRAAGELRIPFTSGILVGIGETEADRIEALEALAAVHAEYGHLQEVILQNFVPHRRYYGEEPAEIAEEAQRSGTQPASRPQLPRRGPPRSRSITCATLVASLPEAHAGRGHPDPAEPLRLVAAPGGRRAPRTSAACPPTATTSRPSIRSRRCTRCASGSRRAAQALAERLCVYPQYMDSEWLEQGVLDVIKIKYWSLHPAQRLRAARGAGDPARAGAGRDRAGARTARRWRGGAHRAVRRDPPRGDRGHAPGGRRAARRAGRRHGHVRGEPQHQRLERVHRRLRVLRLRPGPPLARRLRALRGGVPAAGARGGRVRRHRDLHAVGHPPGLEARGLRALAA